MVLVSNDNLFSFIGALYQTIGIKWTFPLSKINKTTADIDGG
jgi:hypothetical protein